VFISCYWIDLNTEQNYLDTRTNIEHLRPPSRHYARKIFMNPSSLPRYSRATSTLKRREKVLFTVLLALFLLTRHCLAVKQANGKFSLDNLDEDDDAEKSDADKSDVGSQPDQEDYDVDEEYDNDYAENYFDGGEGDDGDDLGGGAGGGEDGGGAADYD
jgi:hypothetical protein